VSDATTAGSGSAGGGPRVVFVRPGEAASPESAAALAWLRALPGADVRVVVLDDLPDALADREAIVWIHWTEPPELSGPVRSALDAHVRCGGGALVTLAAATLPAALGWEDAPPDELTDAVWSDDADDLAFYKDFSVFPRIRGLQSFRGHPLFDGLETGGYTWAPAAGERYVRVAYTGERWPRKGRAIAVEKSYIHINPARRLAWECAVGDGWALAIGGYVHFAARDPRYRPHLERLMENALARVAPNGGRARLMGGEWRPRRVGVSLDAEVVLPPALPANASEAFEVDAGELRLERAATDEPYTLAGARAMLVGRERTGPGEVWFHPVRAAARWELTVPAGPGRGADDGEPSDDARTAGGPGGVTGERVVGEYYRIIPGMIERRLRAGGRRIVERTVVAPDQSAMLVELRPEPAGGPPGGAASADEAGAGGEPIHLIWTLETDLRLMWPYPADAAGRLTYAVDGGAVGVQSEMGEWLGVRIAPAPAVLAVANASDGERSRVRIQAELELTGPTYLLLVGAARDEPPGAAVDPAGWAERRRSDRRRQRAERVELPEDAEPELAEAVEWAKWRLSTYRVDVPGLGASLVAGYGPSRRDPFFDGRPGYAWYFGRDACWTALALLALGRYEVVREVLEFLGRHQDVMGKILHECTTSGVVHYDAADSTPLYLLLVGRYLSASGDVETVRREWPRIVRAYEFCLSTDTDGDGLIENTDVGHGWVEFGSLGGHHVSLYLAGIWVAALEALEAAARALGERAFAEDVAYRAAAARSSLELSLYDPIEGRYANGRYRDGALDMTETALIAVPLLLGAVTPERCQGWLDRVASDELTAPWGVRLIPRSHPDYRPDGYHSGAVWPLYTGWVALAERRAGRAESAARHWRQVALLYHAYALGAWPEVVHGEERRRLGIAPDQAWSTAMAVLGAVGGAPVR
jgi:hypothetical protein